MMNRGVTLVALVIAIVVVIILAGIAFFIVAGDNGVLTKATEEELEWSKAEIQEALEKLIHDKLLEGYNELNEGTISSINDSFNEKNMIDYLTGNNGETVYMKAAEEATITDVQGNENSVCEKYYLATTTISSDVTAYGQGTDTSDVFTLEVIVDSEGKSTGEYSLIYYDNDGNSEEITSYYLYDES